MKMVFLVVDDVMLIRRLVKNILVDAGYPDVLDAENGKEAIRILNTEDVDFVITDWLLPGISGIELVKYIRKSPDMVHLPIIMLSSIDDKGEILKAVRAKVDDYIRKPFTASILLSKIKAIIDK